MARSDTPKGPSRYGVYRRRSVDRVRFRTYLPPSVVSGAATASPAAVVGIGLVPAPTAFGAATASPATVAGTGAVPAPLVTGTNPSIVLLTGGGDATDKGTSGNAYTTASVAPGANKLLVLSIESSFASSAGEDPTIAGLGLTWQKAIDLTSSTTQVAIWVARTGGSPPTPGTITFTYTTNRTGHLWSLAEVTNADLSGADAFSALVQESTTSTASGTSGSGALTVSAGASNLTVGAFGIQLAENITATAGTEIDEQQIATPTRTLEVSWGNGLTTLSWSWTTAGIGRIAMTEVRSGVGVPGNAARSHLRSRDGIGSDRRLRLSRSEPERVLSGPILLRRHNQGTHLVAGIDARFGWGSHGE